MRFLDSLLVLFLGLSDSIFKKRMDFENDDDDDVDYDLRYELKIDII